jgi:hypothetical protein
MKGSQRETDAGPFSQGALRRAGQVVESGHNRKYGVGDPGGRLVGGRRRSATGWRAAPFNESKHPLASKYLLALGSSHD